MITGRGPGAPSVTPDLVCTQRRAAGNEAVDLSAIRRTDALIDLLASRRLLRPRAIGDPVIALLSSLNSDVDGPAHAPRRLAAGLLARPGFRRPAAGGLARSGARRPASRLLARSGARRPAASGLAGSRAPAAGRVPRHPGTPVPGTHRYHGAHRRRRGPWVHATAAAMMFLAVAVATAGLLVASTVTWLTAASGRRNSP